MAQLQLESSTYVATYDALRQQWIQLDTERKKLETLMKASSPTQCSAVVGVSAAAERAQQDAQAQYGQVCHAQWELGNFLRAARDTYDAYLQDQTDGEMKLKMAEKHAESRGSAAGATDGSTQSFSTEAYR